MAAEPESRRSALHGPRRNLEVHGPDAGRQGAHLYVPDGGEVGDYVSIGQAGAARAGPVRVDRPRVVGAREDRAGRDYDRWRGELGGSDPPGASSSPRGYPVPDALALRGPRRGDRLPP